jgi:hypothetical protein
MARSLIRLRPRVEIRCPKVVSYQVQAFLGAFLDANGITFWLKLVPELTLSNRSV